MKVKFKNPPINELIIGVYFSSPISNFRCEHVGLLWNKLRDRLPEVVQKEPLLTELQPPVTINTQSDFMPRFWVVSADEASLVQVQRDAFFHNWRRRDSDYPHYSEQVKPNFDHYYDVFETFVQEEVGDVRPQIRLCELSYVDVIESCEYWRGPHDTASVVPSLAESVQCLNEAPASAINSVYIYNLQSGIQLLVAVRTVESSSEPISQRLILEFRARGYMDGVLKSNTDSWFSDAHQAIVECFLRMTSVDIQTKYWIREDSSS